MQRPCTYHPTYIQSGISLIYLSEKKTKASSQAATYIHQCLRKPQVMQTQHVYYTLIFPVSVSIHHTRTTTLYTIRYQKKLRILIISNCSKCLIQINQCTYIHPMSYTDQPVYVHPSNVLYRSTSVSTSIQNVLYRSTNVRTSIQCLIQINQCTYIHPMSYTDQPV